MSSGFLRTVNFGGFDKKDVLTYVDELNTKIYNLETDLNEKNLAIERSGGTFTAFDGAEEYEKALSEERAKLNEALASLDTLRLQLTNYDSELQETKDQISALKDKNEELEEKLASSESSTNADASFDIGSVFIEAKHSADRIISEAKKSAKKTEEDSKELAQQVIDDANNNAENTVNKAQKESERILSTAKAEADYILEQAKNASEGIIEKTNIVRSSLLNNFDSLSVNVEELSVKLSDIVRNSVSKLTDAKYIIDNTISAIKAGDGFEFIENIEEDFANAEYADKTAEVTGSKPTFQYVESVQEPVVEKTEQEYNEDIVTTEEPSKNAFSFDADFLADMAKAVEAEAVSSGMNEDDFGHLSPDEENSGKVSLLDGI